MQPSISCIKHCVKCTVLLYNVLLVRNEEFSHFAIKDITHNYTGIGLCVIAFAKFTNVLLLV